MSSGGTNLPSSRQKRDRGDTPAPGEAAGAASAAAWYDSPMWLLDRWNYEIAIRKTREFPTFAERATVVKNEDNMAWVMRTQIRQTSMLRLEDGVALAALCGDPCPSVSSSPSMEGALEPIIDRRDVALAVAMAKMLAFLPFRGVRANPNKGRPLISDYDGVVCKTPIEEALGMSLEALEHCVWTPRGGFGALQGEYAAAAGALGNIAMVHHLAVVFMHDNSEPILTAFVQGAVASDNASSLELLFRFPPPGWEDVIANYFHLSNSPKPLLLRQFYLGDTRFVEPQSSLVFLSLRQESYWPCTAQIVSWKTFQILLTSVSDEMWDYEPYCPSALHERLVSIILTKKSFLGRGSIAFPGKDVANLLSSLANRVPFHGHCWMGGRKFSGLQLRVMALEQQPEQPRMWQGVSLAMPYGASVSIHIDGDSKVMTVVDVVVKSLELEIAGTQGHVKAPNTVFDRWRNLAMVCCPTQRVTVAGDTYSRFDCVHKALNGLLGTGEPFQNSFLGWLAAGLRLLTCSSGDVATPETHFTDAKTGKTFDRIECLLVELGIHECDDRSWALLGYALGERERMREPEDPETPPSTSTERARMVQPEDPRTPPTTTTVLVPSSITKKTFSALGGNVVGESSLVEVSGDAASDVKGAGGKNGPCGPCSEFHGLSELDCYNIALALSERQLLRFLAQKSPQILQRAGGH